MHPLIALAATAARSPAVTSAGTGTLADWEMNDPKSSTTMVDSGPNHFNGTLKGGVVPDGSTFTFDGSSGVVTVPKMDTVTIGPAPVTVEARVRFDSVPSTAVGDYDLVRATPGGTYRLEIVARKNRTIAQALCFFNGSLAKATVVAGPNLADDTWHTLKCAKNDTSVTLTVDGNKVGSKTVKIGSISITRTPLSIGAKPAGGDWFKGSMDYARIDLG